MDTILTNINVKEKEATETEMRMDKLDQARRSGMPDGDVLEDEANEILLDSAANVFGDESGKRSTRGRSAAGVGLGPDGKPKQKVFLCDECGYSCNAMHTLQLHRTFKHGECTIELEILII